MSLAAGDRLPSLRSNTMLVITKPDQPVIPIFAPYEGTEPYIFVSYAHRDADQVYPIIKRLHGMGYRLWWDKGIEAGEEWPATICDHLLQSTCMLLFLSPEAVDSKWVKKETNVAMMNDIKIVGAFLVKTTLPSALSYQLADLQLLPCEKFESSDEFLEELCKGISRKTQRIIRRPLWVYNAAQRHITLGNH